MTISYPADPMRNPRPLTVAAWLLWAAIPAAAISGLSWIGEYEVEQPGNGGPGGAFGTAAVLLVIWFALVPVVTTLQWLILRRTWHALWLWPAWLFANVTCLIMFCVFLVKNHPILTVFMIGFLPAAVLSLASPKRLRLPAFAVLFISFLGGAALAWAIPYSSSFLLRHLPYQLSHIFIRYYPGISFLVGATVSGFGVWLVSRWASLNRAAGGGAS